MVTKKMLMCSSLLGFLALSLLLLNMPSAFAQANQVPFKLQVASAAVNQAFRLVFDAEKAGANITSSLYQLNIAAELLSKAENAYRTGDNNSATADAGNALLISQQVMTAAKNAKRDAAVSSQNAFWSTIAFTLISAFVFVVALLIVWRKVKIYTIKNLSEQQPEVASQ